MKATSAALRRWHVLAGVIMPDHTHWIVSPIEDRGLSVGDFSTGFKRVLRKRWARSRGSGSADVSIAFCAPVRTCTANGFTYKTTRFGMGSSKERKIGRII
jgi:hypothetical protein